jgi:hypothetical protein
LVCDIQRPIGIRHGIRHRKGRQRPGRVDGASGGACAAASHQDHILGSQVKRLKGLLGLTKPLDDLTSPLKFDSEAGGFIFAKVVAMRKFDDVDWRAIEKAMNELEARLPVKFEEALFA